MRQGWGTAAGTALVEGWRAAYDRAERGDSWTSAGACSWSDLSALADALLWLSPRQAALLQVPVPFATHCQINRGL